MKKKRYTGLLFLLPSLAGVLVFYLIPFLDVCRRSFFSAVGQQFCGLANYRAVLCNQAFRLAAANTVRFLAVCLPLLLLLSFAAAYGLQELKERAGGGLAACFQSIYLIPLAIPSASVVLLWRVVFHRNGMLNGLLAAFGAAGEGVDWMNCSAAFGVLVFAYIWKNMGYDVVLFAAALASVPEQVYEAARVDGAGRGELFCYITLPCMRSAIYMIVVVSLLNSFKVFREAWMVAGSYPQEDIYLLQHLFNNWFAELSMDKLAPGAVLLGGVIAVLVLLLQRGWEEKQA